MIGTFLRGTRRRHGLRLLFALCAFSSLYAVTSSMAQVPAQLPKVPAKSPYLNGGVRWIGRAITCTAPDDWTAARLFRSPRPPAGLADLCVYTWKFPRRTPTSIDISLLFTVSRAQQMTEDVPVVWGSANVSPAEQGFNTGLRTALRAQVGDASLLTTFPATPPVARVVVIDSAPTALHGQIHPGTSRHGDILAHLIEDIVCRPDPAAPTGRRCAAEVTTELALANGSGTLSELAGAIEQALLTWQTDRANAPSTTPARLILNLSLGWEHREGVADCSAGAPALMGLPAQAVRGSLQNAASQGALIIAAAGNDSGGSTPTDGLLCPGRYQAVPRDADSSQSLVVAVSGLDYADNPLETVRRHGITGIAGLGFGGVAWDPADPVPPPLTGSSVSTAVVSAVSALVWAYQPSFALPRITQAVYAGGIEVGAADACPLSIYKCRSRRVSVCGALLAAAVIADAPPPRCSIAAAEAGSSPTLPNEITALDGEFWTGPPGAVAPASLATLPRYLLPTVQIQPWTFPMPVEESCPRCYASMATSDPHLTIPGLGQTLRDPMLVVQFASSTNVPNPAPYPIALIPPGPSNGTPTLVANTPYWFHLPANWGSIQSAFITGYDVSMSCSVTAQIFVQP